MHGFVPPIDGLMNGATRHAPEMGTALIFIAAACDSVGRDD
jgi:hypothetical protein